MQRPYKTPPSPTPPPQSPKWQSIIKASLKVIDTSSHCCFLSTQPYTQCALFALQPYGSFCVCVCVCAWPGFLCVLFVCRLHFVHGELHGNCCIQKGAQRGNNVMVFVIGHRSPFSPLASRAKQQRLCGTSAGVPRRGEKRSGLIRPLQSLAARAGTG